MADKTKDPKAMAIRLNPKMVAAAEYWSIQRKRLSAKRTHPVIIIGWANRLNANQPGSPETIKSRNANTNHQSIQPRVGGIVDPLVPVHPKIVGVDIWF